MIVCVCARVSDNAIRNLANAGLSFEEIQYELGISVQCGACEEFSRMIIHKTQASKVEIINGN